MKILNLNNAARKMLEDPGKLPVITVKRKRTVYTVKAYSRQNNGELRPLEDTITPVEGLVLDLAYSMYNAGKEEFTALDLLATGKRYIDRNNTSYSQIQEIEAAIYALRDVLILVTPKKEEAGQLLPVFTSGKATLARDKTLIVWRFKSEPLLLAVSKDIFKGVLEYPSELLAIGDTRGLESLALKKYLLDRVYYCNAQKGRYANRGGARNILFRSIYVHMYGAEKGERSQREQARKRRLRKKVIDLIGAYSKSEICPLAGYTVYNTHKSKTGNSIGFHLLFGEEKPERKYIAQEERRGAEDVEEAAEKVREGFKVTGKRGGETLEN